MPLILPKSVCMLIPRAASTWVRQAIRNGGIPYREHGPKHSTELPPNAPQFRFCLTRQPETWIRSRWALGPWSDELTPFWDLDVAKFVAAVSPAMVTMYFSKYTNGCQFVGAVENAADDLVKALRLAGEEFDETALRATKRVNESPADGQLVSEFYWQLKRDQLGQLPPQMIARLPVELIHKLPPGTLDKLPPDVLANLVPRLTTAALQAAGAGIR